MMILFWIVGSIVAYVFVMGLLRRPFSAVEGRKCKKCRDGLHYYEVSDDYRNRQYTKDSKDWHNGNVYAGFWPITLPFTLGSLITDNNRAERKQSKIEARRKNEIEEAKHQAELAKIQATEAKSRAEEDSYLTRQLQDR